MTMKEVGVVGVDDDNVGVDVGEKGRLYSLPSLETNPILLLRFNTENATEEVIAFVEKLFVEAGLIILSKERGDLEENKHQLYMNLTTTQKVLEEEAERIRLMKPTHKHEERKQKEEEEEDNTMMKKKLKKKKKLSSSLNIIENFSVAKRNIFCNVSKAQTADIWGKKSNGSSTEDCYFRDEYHLFTSNDRVMLLFRILDGIDIYLQDESIPNAVVPYLKRKKKQHHEKESLLLGKNNDDDDDDDDDDGRIHSRSLGHFLLRHELVDVITARHIPSVRDALLQESWKWNRLRPPIHRIRDYFGEEIAFYFAWIGTLSVWLLVPGFIGLFFYLLRLYRQVSIDDDEYTPFFSLFMFLWAIIFAKYWDRIETRLAYQWGTYSLSQSHYERTTFLASNMEFIGTETRISPVTGQKERYYPSYKRRFKYVASAIVTCFMLSIAFTVMIMSLNLQGYIHPGLNPKRWNPITNPHPFYYPTLAQLSRDGELFDVNSIRSFIPIIIHVICILTLNNIYRTIATNLTKWENHETHVDFENSLIFKRFLFEAFDCYIALFYLAFYERDMDKLRVELVAVYNIDVIRRVLLESIVPTIFKKVGIYQRKRQIKNKAYAGPPPTTTTTDDDDEDNDTVTAAEKEMYEQFDDYIEMVIQFGYVTLFASAYPLASLLSAVDNYFEIKSDIYKLCRVYQRPRSYRTDGLGIWKTLFRCMIWMSAMTNCLLVGFTSNQLMEYFPGLYVEDENGDAHLLHDKGFITVFIIFGLERLLLLIGLIIDTMIPSIPEDVLDQIDRLHYVRTQRQHRLVENVAEHTIIPKRKDIKEE